MPKVVKDYLYNLMKENKIESVNINFSGGGDDGDIECPEFFPQNINDVGEDEILIPEYVIDALVKENIYCGPIGERAIEPLDELTSLRGFFSTIIKHWVYNELPIDWVNGDGGRGSCNFCIKNNKINIEVNGYEWVQKEGPNYSCRL